MAYGFGTTDGTGASDRIDMTIASLPSGDMTISCWVNWNSAGPSNNGHLYMFGTSGGILYEGIYNASSTGTMRFERIALSGGPGRWHTTTSLNSLSGWIHLALTYNDSSASNDPQWYINGVADTVIENQSPGDTPRALITDSAVFGNRKSYDRNWDGRLEEFARWNRILSADEIAALAKRFSPLFFRNGLVHYLPSIANARDVKLGTTGSVTGALVVPHSSILYPGQTQISAVTAAVPPTPVPTEGGLVTYTLNADTGRNNAFETQLLADTIQASWQNGIMESFGEFGAPAYADFTLSNKDGDYTQETLGSELLADTGFDNWSAGSLVDWQTSGESGSDPVVTEVGVGEGSGGTGSGYANLYTTADPLAIIQNVMTSGLTYKCVLTIDTVVEGGVQALSGSTVVSPVTFTTPGVKTFYFVADDGFFSIQTVGETDITLASVSLKEASTYGGVLKRGLLIRLQATLAGYTWTLYTGKITDLRFEVGSHRSRSIAIRCVDQMLDLLDLEYQPTLLTDVVTSAAIQDVFDKAVLPYPYPHSYWMLGIEGYSVLGSTTTLYSHALTSLDTGKTSLPYVGDNADSGQGISAQGFLRDVVAAEMGGRFWFDTRTGKFTFHNRHNDILNQTVKHTFTETDFDEAGYLYADVLANKVTLNIQPREVGAAGTVLWSAANTPVFVKKGEQRRMSARFRDPDNTAQRVGAMDVLPVHIGSQDITINTAEDGSGESITDRFAISTIANATSAEIVLENGNRDAYVTQLQIRGTPLFTYDQVTVEVIDGQSIADNSGTYPMPPKSLRLVSDEALAVDYAGYLLSRFKTPYGRFDRVSFAVGEQDALIVQALDRKPGDRITITEAWSGHSQDYYIVGEQHTLSGYPVSHRVTWILKPAVAAEGWILDTATRSNLDTSAILVF